MDIPARILSFAVDWDGERSPESLAFMLNLGLKAEWLQDYDARRYEFLPTPVASLLQIAIGYYQESNRLPDPDVLRQRFLAGPAGRIIESRGGGVKGAAEVEAEAAIAVNRAGNEVSNGSELGWLVDEARKKFKGLSIQRLLCQAGSRVSREDPDAVLRMITDQGHALLEEGATTGRVVDAGASAHARLDDYLIRKANVDKVTGLKTGFPTFDRLSLGIQPGQVMLVSGQTGGGKSLFRTRILANFYLQGYSVVDCLREQFSNDARHRLECMLLADRIGWGEGTVRLSDRLLGGQLPSAVETTYAEMLAEMEERSNRYVFIEPDAYGNLDEVGEIVAGLKRQYNVAAVGVDDLHGQTISGAGDDRDDLRQGNVIRWIKDGLAIRYRVAVLVETQEKQTTIGKRDVTLQEIIPYSSRISHKTDSALRLFSRTDLHPDIVEIQVLKNKARRSGYSFNTEINRESLGVRESSQSAASFSEHTEGLGDLIDRLGSDCGLDGI